jgi:hypothetical protein
MVSTVRGKGARSEVDFRVTFRLHSDSNSMSVSAWTPST